MLIIDAHQDLAYNALAFGRDYRQSVHSTRAQEANSLTVKTTGTCLVGLPELLEGNVALVFGTLFTMPARRALQPGFLVYDTPQQAQQQARQQLDIYQRWADEHPQIRLVSSQRDLDAVLRCWQPETPVEQRQVGLMISMENADPIRTPDELETWFASGLRIIGPAWASNRYTGSASQPGPLTDLGRALLDAMLDLGLGLDLSHMAERAAYESLDRFAGVLLASHSNPRSLAPGERQLSDRLIRAIAERDGVIGAVLYNRFLLHGWRHTDGKDCVTLKHVVDAIDHMCQVAGSAAHVGLGSDFDGGLGRESAPAEIDSVADLPKLAAALRERGFAPDDVAAVMGGNWLRLLRRLLPN